MNEPLMRAGGSGSSWGSSMQSQVPDLVDRLLELVRQVLGRNLTDP